MLINKSLNLYFVNATSSRKSPSFFKVVLKNIFLQIPYSAFVHWVLCCHSTLGPVLPSYTGSCATIVHWVLCYHRTLGPVLPSYTVISCKQNPMVFNGTDSHYKLFWSRVLFCLKGQSMLHRSAQ